MTTKTRTATKPQGMSLAAVKFERHFIAQAIAKGFTAEDIRDAVENPYKITDVTRYPGQNRYCGKKIAVVMDGNRAVTCYLDGIVTPRRADQIDEAAMNSRRLASVA